MKKLIPFIIFAFISVPVFATIPANFVGLLQLKQFMLNHQAGNAQLYTDGHGFYWTSRKAYDPVSGAALPNVVTKADVASAQAALPLLQAFLALVPSATVATKPANLQ